MNTGLPTTKVQPARRSLAARKRRTTRVEFTTLTSREQTKTVPKAKTRSPAKLAKPPQTYTPSNCGPDPFFSRSGEGVVRTIGEVVRPRRATHTLRTSRSPREVTAQKPCRRMMCAKHDARIIDHSDACANDGSYDAPSHSCKAQYISVQSLIEIREGKNGLGSGTSSKRGTHTLRTSRSSPSNKRRSDNSSAKRVTCTISLVCPPRKCNQRTDALSRASHNARRVFYSDTFASACRKLCLQQSSVNLYYLHSLELRTRPLLESREGKTGM